MEKEEYKAQRLLLEFDAEEGRLDLLAVQVPSDENRKIRDEILKLAGGAKVIFQNIEADAIRVQIVKNPQAPEGTCMGTEEMVRVFEDAGWGWGWG